MARKQDATKRLEAEVDELADQGYFGTTPDPTPNDNYTVAGVTSDKPTPETDEKLAAEARRAVRGY